MRAVSQTDIGGQGEGEDLTGVARERDAAAVVAAVTATTIPTPTIAAVCERRRPQPQSTPRERLLQCASCSAVLKLLSDSNNPINKVSANDMCRNRDTANGMLLHSTVALALLRKCRLLGQLLDSQSAADILQPVLVESPSPSTRPNTKSGCQQVSNYASTNRMFFSTRATASTARAGWPWTSSRRFAVPCPFPVAFSRLHRYLLLPADHALLSPPTTPPVPVALRPLTSLLLVTMGHAAVWNSHPKGYGKGSRACRVCGSKIGLIRKYSLDICRRCFRENANAIGFHKVRWVGRTGLLRGRCVEA